MNIELSNIRYVMLPVSRSWLDAAQSPGEPLPQLNAEHVYYCHPKGSHLNAGDKVLLYETQKQAGRGAAIGSATVRRITLDEPAVLFERFSDLGVYQLADLETHKCHRGKAMALQFSDFEAFPHPVLLADIRRYVGHKTSIQGISPILGSAYEKIRAHGFCEPQPLLPDRPMVLVDA
jgi:predicted transcriptional regulator